jgi:hypothetical protein
LFNSREKSTENPKMALPSRIPHRNRGNKGIPAWFFRSQFFTGYETIFHPFPKEVAMTVNIALEPLLALIAGIAILARPKLLSYIVAIYLIVVGIIGIFGL